MNVYLAGVEPSGGVGSVAASSWLATPSGLEERVNGDLTASSGASFDWSDTPTDLNIEAVTHLQGGWASIACSLQ